ncbi:MAG: hypothetical protein ACO1NS_09140 [Daejeonella sp.]|uniref:hypothetical protein n=1 Tax=Daejeonella sp. JGW-45 TaxID=3034148 RepID=UPI0023EC4529|nr:hypothetical protein [Daejeonella sp. JGW-45]
MASKNNKAKDNRDKEVSSFPLLSFDQLTDFCSGAPLFKGDEDLRDSFESFFVNDYQFLENVPGEEFLGDFEAIEDILPVLYELGKQLVAEGGQHEAREVLLSDSSNRLYASLKRHPE